MSWFNLFSDVKAVALEAIEDPDKLFKCLVTGLILLPTMMAYNHPY
jgi:hypothetical protein